VLRYFAAATAIVAAAIALILALPRGAPPVAKPRYVTATGTPGPPDGRERDAYVPQAVTGDAPWALSALPGCFRQVSHARGPLAFVRAAMPPGARAVPPGRVLTTADCTLATGDGVVTVRRGENVLRIPPPARLYATVSHLYLLTRRGAGAELRTYVLTNGAAPRFEAAASRGAAGVEETNRR
jgi:hypothetical protein